MTILSNEPIGDDRQIPRAALLLGWAGVIPFAAGALSLLVRGATDSWVLVPFLGYGAVILSFLGGVRWGIALRLPDTERQARALAASVVPSLAAWLGVALAAHPVTALVLLGAGHAAQGVWDIRDARAGLLPRWYGALRVQLTTAAVFAIALGLTAVVLR